MSQSLLETLPEPLRERVLPRGDQAPAGEFVLLWLHHALRTRANPALDAALAAAAELDRPLVIYQGLGGAHRFNADRHHRFILESARDLAQELEGLGHRLHLHLPQGGSGREAGPPASPLRRLADRAALVVTELYPVPPFSGWYRGALAAARKPWWFVDATCLVPMTLSRKRHDRAFAFRRAWEHEYAARSPVPWRSEERLVRSYEGPLEFEPFDLAGDLAEAIARCPIDHGIGPVGHTPGGARAARDRWDRFRARGLSGYANQRNDAAVPWPRGVSRLSPYLHYGCISALEIAPELTAARGKGPEKLFDELLIWRELSHHFCFRTPDPESLAALPDWARESLEAHADDPRPALFDAETLARGRTGEALWDLAQQSLLRQGELHNNLRMTWGKALLGWTGGPGEALERLLDLNHRYALDGNDPNSYGGILWCLGQFDRPFRPEQPVLGAVRPRSVAAHARRLDTGAYEAKVLPPAGGRTLRCIVIGAGLSGLAAARTLADHGHEVVVLDKGRGPGGRASTRRRTQDDLSFDHGAQYFTARDPRFRRHVEAWEARGIVAPWEARVGALEGGTIRPAGGDGARYLGVPGMSAVAEHLAADLEVHTRCAVTSVGRAGEGASGEGPLLVETADGDHWRGDLVVASGPPESTVPLLGGLDLPLPPVPSLRPCWALMVELAQPLLEDWGGLFVNDPGPLAWLARQASRPGRSSREGWVAHATGAWSETHLEADPEAVTAALLDALRALPGAGALDVLEARAHRWRYAQADAPETVGSLWYEAQGVVLCGDWLHGSRVEGAFLSGVAAAGRVLGSARALGR